MVEINLLAWRAQKSQFEQRIIRQFILAGMIVALVVLSSIHLIINHQLNERTERVSQLKARLPMAANTIEPAPTAEREHLFLPPVRVAKLLSVVSASQDIGVCYQRIQHRDAKFSLAGKAPSVTAVTSSLHQIEASQVFDSIHLRDMKRQTIDGGLQFTFNASGA